MELEDHRQQWQREAVTYPDHSIETVVSPKRVRIVCRGEVVADSIHALLLRESGHSPSYYLPRRDCRIDHLEASPRRVRCPYKGEARFWHLRAGGQTLENVVWEYDRPGADGPDLRGYLTFEWDRMDAWLEEDEEIFVHPRDPYKRIDALPSSRHVRVLIGGEVVAETRRPVLLFETGLPTRYYLHKVDVRLDRLVPSNLITRCPYKGEARYYSVRGPHGLVENIAWYYRYPLPEACGIAGRLSFFNERVDGLYVDGRREEPVPTPWSRH